MTVIHYLRDNRAACDSTMQPRVGTESPALVGCQRCRAAVARLAAADQERAADEAIAEKQRQAAHAAGFGDAYDWLISEDNPTSRMSARIVASVGEYLLEAGFAPRTP